MSIPFASIQKEELIRFIARRPRPTPSTALPRERLPVGAPTSTAQKPITPHITIISRQSDLELSRLEESETPVHTNPSFLTETDPGLDLHHRDLQKLTPRHHATFADMARAGLGAARDRARIDHMVSQEPVSLSSYVKFKKPRNRKSGYSLAEEEVDGEYYCMFVTSCSPQIVLSRSSSPDSHQDELTSQQPLSPQQEVETADYAGRHAFIPHVVQVVNIDPVTSQSKFSTRHKLFPRYSSDRCPSTALQFGETNVWWRPSKHSEPAWERGPA